MVLPTPRGQDQAGPGEARADGFTLLQESYGPADLIAAVETAPANAADEIVRLSERARR